MPKSHYETLKISPDASEEEIKKAFRKLAKKVHPDIVGKSGEEKFKELNEAFSVLKDLIEREKYDQTLPAEIVEPIDDEYEDEIIEEEQDVYRESPDEVYRDIDDYLNDFARNIWRNIEQN
jgi:curved DNA-binding protein CbpA